MLQSSGHVSARRNVFRIGWDASKVRCNPSKPKDGDGLGVFFFRMICLRVAAAVYFFADLLMPAAPVVLLANRAAVATLTSTALLGSFGVQRRRAGGTGREEVHVLIGS